MISRAGQVEHAHQRPRCCPARSGGPDPARHLETVGRIAGAGDRTGSTVQDLAELSLQAHSHSGTGQAGQAAQVGPRTFSAVPAGAA